LFINSFLVIIGEWLTNACHCTIASAVKADPCVNKKNSKLNKYLVLFTKNFSYHIKTESQNGSSRFETSQGLRLLQPAERNEPVIFFCRPQDLSYFETWRLNHANLATRALHLLTKNNHIF